MMQGRTDPYNAATWPIEHLEQIENFSQEDVSDFMNPFMIPGGGHCGAAQDYPAVPSTYHTMSQLVEWVDRGRKPEAIVRSDPPDGSQRSPPAAPAHLPASHSLPHSTRASPVEPPTTPPHSSTPGRPSQSLHADVQTIEGMLKTIPRYTSIRPGFLVGKPGRKARRTQLEP